MNTCLCQRNADGRCPTCTKHLRDQLATVVSILQTSLAEYEAILTNRIRDVVGHNPCVPCERELRDAIMAQFLRDFLPTMPPETRRPVADMFVRLIPLPHPLMDRALTDVLGMRAAPAFGVLKITRASSQAPTVEGTAIAPTWKLYRRMSQSVVKHLLLPDGWEEKMIRASQDVICKGCSLAYREHPEVFAPTFHMICDGTVVKL